MCTQDVEWCEVSAEEYICKKIMKIPALLGYVIVHIPVSLARFDKFACS